MKTSLFSLMICLFFPLSFVLQACDGSSPASNDKNDPYIPEIHTLEKIELPEASTTLVLASRDIQASSVMKTLNNGVQSRCEALGSLEGASYQELTTHGNLTPCFKNIRRIDHWIYGQYRPDDSSNDVWFITDSVGNVHHLPEAPAQALEFSNVGRIKKLNSRPAYLNQQKNLVSWNFETKEEDTVIPEPVGRWTSIVKSNGEHIFYTNLEGGQRMKPDKSIERLTELDACKLFYPNKSNDLEYVSEMRFKRMLLDADGIITDRAASAVPVAYEAWLGTVGEPMPDSPVISSVDCVLDDGLLLCGEKGYLVNESGEDMVGIDWSENFEVYGDNPNICLSTNYIYFSAGSKLTQIDRDLSAFEHVLTGYDIRDLKCLGDGNLLIKTSDQTFEFDPVNKLRTIIPASISSLVK